jgi:hypothetical protein
VKNVGQMSLEGFTIIQRRRSFFSKYASGSNRPIAQRGKGGSGLGNGDLAHRFMVKWSMKWISIRYALNQRYDDSVDEKTGTDNLFIPHYY